LWVSTCVEILVSPVLSQIPCDVGLFPGNPTWGSLCNSRTPWWGGKRGLEERVPDMLFDRTVLRSAAALSGEDDRSLGAILRIKGRMQGTQAQKRPVCISTTPQVEPSIPFPKHRRMRLAHWDIGPWRKGLHEGSGFDWIVI
jgi:hypothetical protein